MHSKNILIVWACMCISHVPLVRVWFIHVCMYNVWNIKDVRVQMMSRAWKMHKSKCTNYYNVWIIKVVQVQTMPGTWTWNIIQLTLFTGHMITTNDVILILTPSLPQHVQFPGWEMHACTCKQYISWSYSTSTFNAMCFDLKNPFMLVEKNKQRLKGFEFGTFIGCFQMTPGSEGVSQASQQKQHSEVGPKH